MCLEFYDYVDKLQLEFVPQRSFHRQCLTPWITPETSNLIKRLHTKKQLLKHKSPEQSLSVVDELENQVISKMEEKLLRISRKTPELTRHSSNTETFQKSAKAK